MKDKSRNNSLCKDNFNKKTQVTIEQFGFQVVKVGGTAYSPSFAYSIGLFKNYHHPEIICFGLPSTLCHEIITDVVELIKRGEVIKTCTNYPNIFKNSRAEFLTVQETNIEEYLLAARNYYKDAKFPAIQLVWTDRNDKFPWEENFEEKYLYDQPLLDRNVDFKFREPKNLGIYTTRQWLELNQPILQVVHDLDGDWQFLTGDQMPDDIKIVGLEQMVLKDNSLNEAHDLDYGYSMDRDFIGGEWTITKLQEDIEE